jgi:two-component system, OmpR family, sensor kinase
LKPVESLGSYIRSAAQATFSAYRSVPVRWRLAGGSAALTFVILAAFAVIVALFTANEVRNQFNNDVRKVADQLASTKLREPDPLGPQCNHSVMRDYSAEGAQIRVYDVRSATTLCTQNLGQNPAKVKPSFPLAAEKGDGQELGYRVAVRDVHDEPGGDIHVLYARPLSEVDHTLNRVRFLLLLGVLGGAVLALLAGLYVARRAMRPIAQLTEVAREIERTRDPSRRLPFPEAEDEVAELARTLDGMLAALDASRSETEAMLSRQREFIADASHELRTPLTSVLANLELLSEELTGEQADTAHAALRSTRRMRRLVGDLLLLARADAKRTQPQRATDLAAVLVEAAGELEPVAEGHELSVEAEPAIVTGTRDDLHRLTLNLLENAIRHTPPGTHIRASTAALDGIAVLTVEDDGPGIPPELEQRVFERFVRGARDGRRGSGLGLAIVRAVVEAHGGSVRLERPQSGSGTRLVIRLPADVTAGPKAAEPNAPDHDRASA